MLVLDANILIRAVLGSRVLGLTGKYAGQVEFLAPDTAFEECREHLSEILKIRGLPVASAMAVLDLVAGIVNAATGAMRTIAALALDCPIWAEDTDFFGCGVATWTTDRVELYLAKASEKEL